MNTTPSLAQNQPLTSYTAAHTARANSLPSVVKPPGDLQFAPVANPAAIPSHFAYRSIYSLTKAGDYITVITARDPNTGEPAPIGKQLIYDIATGQWRKEALGDAQIAKAVVRYIMDLPTFLGILQSLTPHDAVVLGAPSSIKDGGTFTIESQARLLRRLGQDPASKNHHRPTGFYTDTQTGERYLARLKENFAPSTLRLIDVDIAENTPAEYRNPHWVIAQLDKAAPEMGFKEAQWLAVPSSSSRILLNGSPVLPSSGSYHIYVRVEQGSDVIRQFKRLHELCFAVGYAYQKTLPSGRVTAATLFDNAPNTASNRIVYTAPPRVAAR